MTPPNKRFYILRWAEWGGAVIAVLVAVVIVWSYRQYRTEAAGQALAQNCLKMETTRDHVVEYFENIRLHLRTISLDNEVVAMTRDSYESIKAIYEEQYQRHRLSEIYVIERDFDGTRPPLMTFDHGDEDREVAEVRSLEREAERYRIQMEQIRRFARDPSLGVLISEPIGLCVDEVGVVLSVPIRSNGELVGIVAGMIPSLDVTEILEWGNYANTVVLLANERGDIFSSDNLPEQVKGWFRARFDTDGVAGFFRSCGGLFHVEEYTALWIRVRIPGQQKWYLAFLYDEAASLQAGGILGVMPGWGAAAAVLLLGGAVITVSRTLRRRLKAEKSARQATEALIDALAKEIRLGRDLGQAEDAARSKSQFLANMSHEIRTPMTAILGFAENLLDPDLTESDRVNAVRTICRNGRHLLTLIDDILNISKIEAGMMTVERTACSPCRVVADVASLVQGRINERKLRFKVEYEGAIPETIQTDPTRLKQILVNLVANAVKFTESGGIRLITRLVNDGREPRIQFDVVDTGIGMTEDQVGKLFQPFAQADPSTTRKYGGTGLGLTISRHFAKLLGGDITVQSKPGKGSIFRVTIATGPLDGVKMIGDPAAATVVAPDVPTSMRLVQGALDCRILLAEDGPDNQRLISFVLKKAGADVTVAENGQVAVDKVLADRDTKSPFDVVLMDMQMPVMDGYEATRLLRQKGFNGPIIALTAHAMAGAREQCLNAGCDDYAAKPIDREKLIAAIRTHLDKSTAPPGAKPLSVG